MNIEEYRSGPAGEQHHGEMKPVELLDVLMELPRADPIVVLREVDPPYRLLRFPVGWCEGLAISYGLRSVATPRPLSHENFTDVLSQFGITVELLRITALSGKTLMAVMVLAGGGNRKEVECRPSDGLALMLRQPLAVPIVVSSAVLDAVGETQ